MEKTSRTQTDLSRYNNDWYRPGSSIKRLAWFIIGRMLINTYLPIPMGVKRNILRLFGAKIGAGVVIKPKVNIKYPWFLEIGDHCWIGERVWIDNLNHVTIGKHVCLSQDCYLLTGNHNYRKVTFDLVVKSITLADGSWIGAKAVVCPGVKVGSHAVLAVGSVATKHLEPFGIYQGNPAAFIKTREIKD